MVWSHELTFEGCWRKVVGSLSVVQLEKSCTSIEIMFMVFAQGTKGLKVIPLFSCSGHFRVCGRAKRQIDGFRLFTASENCS